MDRKALYRALKEKRIAGAGLDVFAEEPTKDDEDFKDELAGLENVVLTSHLGASTHEAQRKTSQEMARVITDYLLRGDFSNAVNVGENVEAEQRALNTLFIFHQDVFGAFASIDKVLGDNNINIRENNSRAIGRGNVLTAYLVHQRVKSYVLDQLNSLPIVHYAKV